MKSIIIRNMDWGEIEIVNKIFGESFNEPYPESVTAVSYTHLTLPTNREV